VATAAEAASTSAVRMDATVIATLAALAVVMELEAAEAVAIVVESVVSIATPCGSVATSMLGEDGLRRTVAA